MDCRVNYDQINAFQAYNPGNQNPNLYHPNMRNHPNFSWRGTNVLNPPQQQQQAPYQRPYQPPGFQAQNVQQTQQFQQAPVQNESNVEAMLKQMMDQMSSMDQRQKSMDQRQKSLETQLAQIATSSSTRQQGSLPSKANQPNETLHAVTLRSGTQYKNPEMPRDEEEIEKSEKLEKTLRNRSVLSETDRSVPSRKIPEFPTFGTDRFQAKPGGFAPKISETRQNSTETDVLTPQSEAKVDKPNSRAKVTATGKETEVQLPYPSRQRRDTTDSQFNQFLEVLNGLKVSVPFMQLLLQIPSYAKFVKEILSRKRPLPSDTTVAFTEECSSLIQGRCVPKLCDPGSFSIPCTIGHLDFSNALCDLGASISVMPYSVYLKLNAGELKETSANVMLADRSLRKPRGILEDMPMKIGQFWIPVDFMVMDIPEDAKIPIILGRPFLKTAGAVIDVKRGRMTLEIGDETVAYNMTEAKNEPMVPETLGSADILSDADWYMSLLRDPCDTLLSVECVADDKCRSKEKQKAVKSPVWGRKDPRGRTDPRWERVYDMHDNDFEDCGEYPVEFVNALYGSAHKLLYDPAGKGADGVP